MEAVQQLTNFDVPFNVELFDAVVAAFYQGDMRVQAILVSFQEHPLAWTRVDSIVETSSNDNAKQLALCILENCVKFRWKTLPPEQREGIRNYTVNLVIKLSSDDQTLQVNQRIVNKLNLVLVELVRREWPQNWPNFIPDLVGASKTGLLKNPTQPNPRLVKYTLLTDPVQNKPSLSLSLSLSLF